MTIMSFAHLKKQKPTAQPDPPAMKKSETAVKEVSDSGSVAVDPLALLMESKFCYGCEAFSIDAPDTDKEVGWCARALDVEGKKPRFSFEFKRIC